MIGDEPEDAKNTRSAADQVFALYKALLDDVTNVRIELIESDTPANRRALVRLVYSFIEGHVYQMKQYAVFVHRTVRPIFSDAELALLTERTYRLNDRGQAEEHSRFLKLPHNLRFAFDAFARAHGLSSTLDVSGKGWAAFKAGRTIRDRLAHPKTVDSLDVSSEEVATVEHALDWFATSSGDLFRRCSANMGNFWLRDRETGG